MEREGVVVTARSLLSNIWRGWKRIGQALGDVIARVVLTAFYFTVFVPFGLGVRIFSGEGDAGRSNRSRLWEKRIQQEDNLEKAKRLY